jgi:hypothetical protein
MVSWFSSLIFGPDVWTQIKSKGRSLQCHLDVNGVILGQETIEGKLTPPEEYASIMLANGTYSQWIPGKSSKSYKAYVWEDLHPGSNSDPALRRVRKESLRQFTTTLVAHKHPLAQRVTRQYRSLLSVLQRSPIFPGFSNLIRTLQENMIPHQFIFRTFGGDGELIRDYLANEFPQIQLQSGRFDEGGVFHFRRDGHEVALRDPDEFREVLKSGHWLVQDNFERWRRGQEQGDYGKLFPFSSNPQDPILSIFADDNLEIVSTGNQRTIVCCYDAERRSLVSTQQASSRLIKVNPIEAALDPNYLTTRVSKAAEALLDPSRSKRSLVNAAIATTAAVTALAAGILVHSFRSPELLTG